MQNTVPTIENEVARRVLSERIDAYADEVRRFIDAAYAVMRRTDSIDPQVRDIVRQAGLSNQAFYRHFATKDELFLAVLEDGRRLLIDTLDRRMAAAGRGPARVRAWIEGVLEQARNPRAAANTRPFAINGARLRDRFPAESAVSVGRLIEPLEGALVEAGSPDPARDALAVYELAFATMHRLLTERRAPSRADTDHLVLFVLSGIGRP